MHVDLQKLIRSLFLTLLLFNPNEATFFFSLKSLANIKVSVLKPDGIIGNMNYLGSGDTIKIPRIEWAVGMRHKTIRGGLMPSGRLRMEKLAKLITSGRLDLSYLVTHRFNGFDHIKESLYLMKDKPCDLINPVVVIDKKYYNLSHCHIIYLI